MVSQPSRRAILKYGAGVLGAMALAERLQAQTTSYMGPVNSTTGALLFSPSDAGGAFAIWGTYTCPGSGTQTLGYLGGYAIPDNTTNLPMRVALYTSNGLTKLEDVTTNLVAAGPTQWYDIATSAVSLTGGTSYILMIWASSTIHIIYDAMDSSVDYTGPVDYSAGAPSTIPSSSGATARRGVRATVVSSGAVARPSGLSLLGVR